jgi:hypothetical protein
MAPGAAGVLLVAVCIRGPLKLQYAVIDLLAAPMAQLSYKQRIRPLRFDQPLSNLDTFMELLSRKSYNALTRCRLTNAWSGP